MLNEIGFPILGQYLIEKYAAEGFILELNKQINKSSSSFVHA
jgi:hypothetical protein